MFYQLLKSKLHGAIVTEASIDYEGSLGIDRDLMDAVRMLPYEKILVANVNNGERFETYAIPAPRGSGTICLNGATARLGVIGDKLLIFTFAMVAEADAHTHRPLVKVLKNNKPVTTPA